MLTKGKYISTAGLGPTQELFDGMLYRRIAITFPFNNLMRECENLTYLKLICIVIRPNGLASRFTGYINRTLPYYLKVVSQVVKIGLGQCYLLKFTCYFKQ